MRPTTWCAAATVGSLHSLPNTLIAVLVFFIQYILELASLDRAQRGSSGTLDLLPTLSQETMNTNVSTHPSTVDSRLGVTQRNRVLRNTYWLLALSMVPTVMGAWVGVATGITSALTGFLGLAVFMGGAFGFMYAIERTKESAAGVPVLLAFTFFMGLMLSRLIGTVLGMANGAHLIMTAFTGTGIVFLGMASLSTVIKRDLGQMGKFLFVGAIMLMVAGVANVFLQSSALMMALSVLAIGIFSAFILYDLKRVQDGEETNYISATLSVYLSLFNVFQSMLALLGLTSGQDD